MFVLRTGYHAAVFHFFFILIERFNEVNVREQQTALLLYYCLIAILILGSHILWLASYFTHIDHLRHCCLTNSTFRRAYLPISCSLIRIKLTHDLGLAMLVCVESMQIPEAA